jgi:hypothetical protein
LIALVHRSSQHPIQLLNPLQDLLLDRPQFRQDFQLWAVFHRFKPESSTTFGAHGFCSFDGVLHSRYFCRRLFG